MMTSFRHTIEDMLVRISASARMGLALTLGMATFAMGNCSQHNEGTFSVVGQFPGLREGARIIILTKEGGRQDTVANGVSADGGFLLSGSIAAPKICQLLMYDDPKIPRLVDLMVENTAYNVSAGHIDSVPSSYPPGKENMMKRQNVSVSAGKIQDQYREYQDYVLPVEADNAEYFYRNIGSPETQNFSKAKRDTVRFVSDVNERILRLKELEFARMHPDYAVSAWIVGNELRMPFSFTEEELTEWKTVLSGMTDNVRKAHLTQLIDKYGNSCKGSPFIDFKMRDADSVVTNFSEIAGKGRPVLVDFWASWCGPCRQAIPLVEMLHSRYGEMLDIISVSIDDSREKWLKAVKAENMPWPQYIVGTEDRAPLNDGYFLRNIPYFILISADGKVLYVTHDVAEMSLLLDEMIQAVS